MQRIPNKTRRRLIQLTVALVLAALGYSSAYPNRTLTAGPVAPGLFKVVKDIDGDTIVVQSGSASETVRLIGVDTPETHDPRKPVQCFGEVAAAKTKSWVEGKQVRLEADPNDSDRDKYHRLLRYVYLPDGTLLNAELIRQGYGFAYTVFPFARLDEFRNYERIAREGNLGLWAGCGIDSSQQIKQTAGTK